MAMAPCVPSLRSGGGGGGSSGGRRQRFASVCSVSVFLFCCAYHRVRLLVLSWILLSL